MIAFFVKANFVYSEFDIFKMSQPLIEDKFPDFSMGFSMQGTGHLLRCTRGEEFRLFTN